MDIKKLNETIGGVETSFYPLTHENAVVDDNGTTIASKIDDLETKYTASQDAMVNTQEAVDDLNANTYRKSETNALLNTKANTTDVYAKSETYNKTELNSMITTPEVEYVNVEATDQTTAITDVLPATGATDTIYKIGSWDGSQYDASKYSEYTWNGSAYVYLATRDHGVDDEPTAGSDNLVKSNSIVGYKRYNIKDKFNLDNALVGYVLNLQGEPVTSQYVTGFDVTDYIAVHAGEVIEYAYGNANENIAIITLAVYNESKEIINVFKPLDTGSGKYYISDINAAYIRYVVFDDTYFNKNNQYLKINDTTWNSLHNLTQKNFFSLVGASLDHYISSTGVITASNQYTKGFAVSDYISVNYKDVVKFAYAMPSNISMGTLNVYNASKQLINTHQSPNSGAGEYTINDEAAAFIRYNIASVDYFSGEQYLKIENENIVNIVNEILSEADLPYIVNVGPSREITKFIDGLSLAMQHPNSRLYVDYGEYDIMTEYGAEANIPKNGTLWGPVIGNNVHVICEEGTVIKADCDTLNLNYQYKEQFSILNVIGSFTIENATIIGKNIRYCVHDDAPIATQNPCHSKYINCNMTHQGFNDGWSGYNAPACLGMGDSGGSIMVEGGSYSSPNYQSISLHNSESARNSVFIINNIYTANDVKLYTFKPAGNTVKTRISNSYIGNGITYQDSEQTRKFNVTQFNIETA